MPTQPGSRGGPAGHVLLEVLVALAILSVAGLGFLEVLQAAARAQREARSMERMLDAAERVLGATALLQSGELDQRLGRRQIGEFVLDVQRPDRELYRLSVAQVTAPQRSLLVTVVFRPGRVSVAGP